MQPAKRSPVLERFANHAHENDPCCGMTMATHGEPIDRQRAALADISAIPKRLFVGAGAANWLRAHAGVVPEHLFECCEGERGATIVRLHYAQYLVIAGLDGGGFEACFDAAQGRRDNTLVLPYESAEFALTGPGRSSLFRELSAFDPAAMISGQWLTTRFAHAEVGLRLIELPEPHLRIVCSPADARFLYDVIGNIVRENDGVLTTMTAYLEFAASGPGT